MCSKARCARAATGCASPAQLIDAETGAHLWADRFDGSLEDVFELQDKIAISVAGVIEPALAGRRDAPLRRAADDRSHRLRSLPARACGLLSNNERADSRRLWRLLEAGDRDRSALRAGARLGRDLPPAARQTAGPKSRRQTAARASILLGRRSKWRRDDPGVLANAALVLAYFGEDIGAMIGLVDRALALNPSFARGWFAAALSGFGPANRSRDRACRDLAAPEPARPRR